jgi:hypothetical protein
VGSSPTSGILENKGFASPHQPPVTFAGRLLLCKLLRKAVPESANMTLLAYSPGPIMTGLTCLICFWMLVVVPIGIIGNLLGVWDWLLKPPADSGKGGSTLPPTAGGPRSAGDQAHAGAGLAKVVGWAVAAVILAVIMYSCKSPPRKMSPQERYYWEHGEGRAIRDEQEYYQDRIPRGR